MLRGVEHGFRRIRQCGIRVFSGDAADQAHQFALNLEDEYMLIPGEKFPEQFQQIHDKMSFGIGGLSETANIGIGVHRHHMNLRQTEPASGKDDPAVRQQFRIVLRDRGPFLQKADEQMIPDGFRAGAQSCICPLRCWILFHGRILLYFALFLF